VDEEDSPAQRTLITEDEISARRFGCTCTNRVRRKSDYTLKNGHNLLIRGCRRLYISSYESSGYDTYNKASQICLKNFRRRVYLTYFFCLKRGCVQLKILQSQFVAYKHHYINLNSSQIDWKSLFAYMRVGIIILNLSTLKLLHFLKIANHFFGGNIFSFLTEC
jgi:hypothetical protein